MTRFNNTVHTPASSTTTPIITTEAPVTTKTSPATTTKSPVTTKSSPGTTCPKCSMFKKSGKPSCCAPGGAWFNNCGEGEDHTWFEGVQTCANAESATESQAQAIKTQSKIDPEDDVYDVVVTDSRSYYSVLHIGVIVGLSLTIFQMYG